MGRARATAAGLGGLIGLGWAWLHGLGPTLSPTFFTWLFQGDYLMCGMGWLFLRNAPWTLPLGSVPNLLHPFGTSIGLTDGVPWVGLAFKLVGGLLPLTFQYFGWWTVGCFVLQGALAAAVAVRLVGDRWAAGLLGGLFALSAPLSARLGHLALMGHFLFVTAVGLALLANADSAQAARRFRWALALTITAAGVHPYLFVMTLASALAVVLRGAWEVRLGWPKALLRAAALPAAGGAVLALLGYLGGPRDAEGFGRFSADLLSLFQSAGRGRLVAELRPFSGSGEGYSYLGLGYAALGVVALLRLALRRPTWRTLALTLPVTLGCLGMAFYALGSTALWRGQPVADLGGLYQHVPWLTGSFRSSGRFLWPLHALIAWAGVAALGALRGRPWLLRVAAAAALGLQVADLKPGEVATAQAPPMDAVWLKDPDWALLEGQYRHLALYPAHIQWVCRFDEPTVIRVGLEAYRRGLSFNSALVGRAPDAARGACERHLGPAELDPDTVYVGTDAFVADLVDAGWTCGVLDGYAVCASPSRDTPFRQALQRKALQLQR